MRNAIVYFRKEPAGVLTQEDNGMFSFVYYDQWMLDARKPAISLTLPKKQQIWTSPHLFPFFYNMLPEGANKQVACRYWRLDESDAFGLLMATATHDTIGAVTIKKVTT